MPPPYGPAPSPDKPVAKAHPSFQGARSLVISSGWRWGEGNTEEDRVGEFSKIRANGPGSLLELLRPLAWGQNFILSLLLSFFKLESDYIFYAAWMQMWHFAALSSISAEGEGDHNASCPGGGDTGMRSSRSTGKHYTAVQ